MTEYWKSQGRQWCDFCKIFLASNPVAIRNHEMGQRHKDSVAKRLDDMRKNKAVKEKEEKEAVRAVEQIEAKARKSYQKDVAAFQERRDTNADALDIGADGDEEWNFDSSSGYYYNQSNGLSYDPKSGFYYSDAIGKWVTQEEAYAATNVSAVTNRRKPITESSTSALKGNEASARSASVKVQSGPPPGHVVSGSLNPMRSVKGATSKVAVKRKRQDEKPKIVSKEEAAALKAREAAKKRVEEREKSLLGLYRTR